MPVRAVERKLTAILAADVVGYSRLMGADEVGTLQRLTACRVIVDGLITAHRGRIFNTAGDSVVADFASVVDAVECAVAVQEALAGENVNRPAASQMQFRIGVHIGDVIVQGDNLLGDGVNIAARLDALAKPGGICVSGAVLQGPTAAMTQDYRNLYRVQMLECARGGFCSSHVCAQGAKANPLTAVLPALARQPNFELRPLCNVLRVNRDSTGKKATGVTYIDPRGNEVEQPAGIVVLGAYCFGNVRLLLLSGIGTPYDPLTGKGVVGRNYSYQQGGSVQVFFEDREFNPFIGGGQVNTSIDEFNGDLIDRGPLGFIGGAYVNTSTSGATPIKGKQVPPGTPRWGGEWKKAVAHYYRRSMSIHIHASCLSYRHNYLDLDPTYKDAYGLPLLRMTFDWNDNDLRMMTYLNERCVEIGRALNGSRLGGKNKGTHFGITGYQSTHNVGGAVMGSDPSTSVVNKYLQSWDVSNLFVVGGSAFPQNPANGPTETIGMLACWAADAIKDYVRSPNSLV